MATTLLTSLAGAATESASLDTGKRETLLQLPEIKEGFRALDYVARMTGASVPDDVVESKCLAAMRSELAATAENVDLCLKAAAKAMSPDWEYRRLRTAADPSTPTTAGIGVLVKQAAAGLEITDVLPGSPASAEHMGRGDIVLEVDGSKLEGRSLDASMRTLRGNAGSAVRLMVRCKDCPSEREVILTRKVTRDELLYATDMSNAWYLQVRGFGGTTGDPRGVASRALELLQERSAGAKSRQPIVLDLRGSSGGFAQAIVDFSAVFLLPELPVMYVASSRGLERAIPESALTREAGNGRARNLIVLVDRDTGSGTEWLAETLRRYGGALIVGQTTAGAVQVRRALEPFTGAQLLFPEGLLLGSGGSVLQGIGVMPDVQLDDARTGQRELGKPPAWLQPWLDQELPTATKARSASVPSAPRQWRGSATDAASTRSLCVGSLVVPWTDSQQTPIRRSSEMTIDRGDARLSISSAQSDVLPFEEAAAAVAADQDRLRSLIETYEAQLRSPKAAKVSPYNRTMDAKSFAEWRMRLPLTVTAVIGTTGARLYRYENGVSEAIWRNSGTNHRITLSLLDDEPTDKVLAAYATVIARLQARPDDAAPPQVPGVCIANGFLNLDVPVRTISWKGVWQLAPDSQVAIELAGRFAAGNESVSVSDRQDAEQWTFDAVPECGPPRPPVFTNTTFAGLPAVSRQSLPIVSGPSSCRVSRAVSRLPLATAPGFDYRGGLMVRDADRQDAERTEVAWNIALQNSSVLALPKAGTQRGATAPDGGTTGRTIPAIAPALPPPPAPR